MQNVTSNPLFQLVGKSEQNNVMFFTPMSDDIKAYQVHYCCVCGRKDAMLLPVNVMQSLSKCIVCYNKKLEWDTRVAVLRKPFELTEEIFGTRK